jgi:hypothetical protein
MVDAGFATAEDWKWTDVEVGFDGNVVCLYRTLSDAVGHLNAYDPTGIILRIDITDEDTTAPSDWQSPAVEMTQVEEGFPAVRDQIPARCITIH